VLFEITANISRTERGCQSDWANFRSLGDCLLWAGFFKLKKVDDIFRLLLPTIGYALSLQKMAWATFWAIFSLTHLLTLQTHS
jgi:hypothetical protein